MIITVEAGQHLVKQVPSPYGFGGDDWVVLEDGAGISLGYLQHLANRGDETKVTIVK